MINFYIALRARCFFEHKCPKFEHLQRSMPLKNFLYLVELVESLNGREVVDVEAHDLVTDL